MDNYEVNVLTRKGGWKKLPQEVIPSKNELNRTVSERSQCDFSQKQRWRAGKPLGDPDLDL